MGIWVFVDLGVAACPEEESDGGSGVDIYMALGGIPGLLKPIKIPEGEV